MASAISCPGDRNDLGSDLESSWCMSIADRVSHTASSAGPLSIVAHEVVSWWQGFTENTDAGVDVHVFFRVIEAREITKACEACKGCKEPANMAPCQSHILTGVGASAEHLLQRRFAC